MKKKRSTLIVVSEFMDAAKEFCSIVEKRDIYSKTMILQKLYLSILELMRTAALLPNSGSPKAYWGSESTATKNYKVLYPSLKKKFGKDDRYSEIYDPYDLTDNRQVWGSLADDICDIYREVFSGLHEWEAASSQERNKIICAWQLFFEIHWGEHGLSALRAIYFILFRRTNKKVEAIGFKNYKGKK
jgi:hypothetical protein